ncbi:MAG: CcmD family protein [Bacteroidia bacterium]|nr:CcmD family protein [Bacteroidia bacterium]
MADTMRAEGKIYVVVAIVLIVLLGLVAYLFLLDKKIGRLEKEMAEKAVKPRA